MTDPQSATPETDVQAVEAIVSYFERRRGESLVTADRRHLADALGYRLAPEPTDQTREQIAAVLAKFREIHNGADMPARPETGNYRHVFISAREAGEFLTWLEAQARLAVHVSPETAEEREADFLIVPMGHGQDAVQVIHEPCGEQVLATMTVHLDTLGRIAAGHVCAPIARAGGR